jgi:TatA/E family protein of Tat protein translocase
MGSLGWQEIMVILVIALIVFGPRKLPQLGKTLGKALGEFRRATNDLKNTLEVEVHKEQEKVEGPKRRQAEDEYKRRRQEKELGAEQAEQQKPEAEPADPAEPVDPGAGDKPEPPPEKPAAEQPAEPEDADRE